ncbi:MAG: RsmD family RNA methyltransferase [Armatimonadetes bacterium]|nr:RsmD family RNA methyltransferase [Armatimonadota bacterium]
MGRSRSVRPTTAKVLESLMASLAPELPGARVLDLFAGTGALGLAALAHGASELVAVEADPVQARFLGTVLPGGARLVRGRLPGALARLRGRFSVVLADPPYGDPAGPATLEQLAPHLESQAVVVFEHHHKDPYPDQPAGLRLERRRRFGETALSYYRGRVTAP